MDLLIASLAAVFVIEVLFFWWPWTITGYTDAVAFLVVSGLLATFYIGHDYVVMALAIAGATLVLRQLFRLLRAWADRVEIANTLPLHRGNR